MITADITTNDFWIRNENAAKLLIECIIEQEMELDEYEDYLPEILCQKFIVAAIDSKEEGDHIMRLLVWDVIDWENHKIYGSLQQHLYRKYIIIPIEN